MNFSDEFKKSDFSKGPYPEAHTIAGKKVPPDGTARRSPNRKGMWFASDGPMPIGLSYPDGQDFGNYIQYCGEGLAPGFGLDLHNEIPFSCGNVHSHTALLLFSLVLNQRPKVIVETGTFYGYSTWFMAEALRLWGDEGSMLYGIDVTDKLIAQEVKEHPKITLLTGDSRVELAKLISEVGEIHFAFLDSYKRIALSEFILIHRNMPPGSIVAFHDTCFLQTGRKVYEWFAQHEDNGKTFEIMLFAGTPHKDNPHRFFGNADDRGLLLVRRKEGNPFLNVADAGSVSGGLGEQLL